MENNTRTNKYGFPVVACSRCHGSGEFSFNIQDGSSCFGCNGKGFVVAKKAVPAWTAFMQAAKKLREKTWGEVQIGDVLKLRDGFAEVVAVQVTNNTLADTATREVLVTVSINNQVSQVKQWENMFVKLHQTKPINVSEFLKMIPEGKK